MRRYFIFFISILVFTSLSFPEGFKLDVQEHVLSNGMKILMIFKPGVPRVVCHVYYKAGSVNERPGITGIMKRIAGQCTKYSIYIYYIKKLFYLNPKIFKEEI